MSRFIKLDATGAHLDVSATDHLMVLDTKTNLIHPRRYASPDEVPFDDAQGLIDALNDEAFGGITTWRLPPPDEAFSLADHSRYAPAINTDYFECGEDDWVWTNQVCASSSVYAWIVLFSSGGVDGLHLRYTSAFVRAVSGPAPAGQ